MTRLLAVLFIFSSITLPAQKYFIPGYYVSSNGDTVKVSIEYSNKDARQCVVQRKDGGETTTYTPREIRGYGFNGNKQFVSKNLPVDSSRNGAVFMEVLMRGQASLYRYGDLFYIEKDKLYVLEMGTVKDG